MRQTIFLLFTFCLFQLQAQDQVITASSKLTDVTVFQSGAQLSRSAKLQVPKGVSSIVFKGISETMNPKTLQFTGDQKMTLLSITTKQDFLSPDYESEIVVSLKKRIYDLRVSTRKIKAKDSALKLEKQMLVTNQKVTGTSVSLDQLQKTAAYFGKRMLELNLEIENIVFELEDLQKKKQKLEKQLQQERQANTKKTNKVIVKVLSEKATTANFKLSYLVNNASWNSTYDARVNDLKKPVELTHKAEIIQSTGEDWNNVNLVLATGNPSAGAQAPYMKPWYVNLRNTQMLQNAPTSNHRNANTHFRAEADQALSKEISFDQYNVSQNITQQEYTVDRKQSIASSGQPSVVILRKLDLDAKYEYHAKPRLDKDAFLIAKVYNWEKYNLLSGNLALFNNTTYVGTAYLNVENPTDTLQLSLGRDKNVIIERTRLIGKQEKVFFGSKRVDTYVWNIEVKNTKNASIILVLRDQIPVSQHEDVEINIKNVDGGRLDAPSGIIKWSIPIAPGKGLIKQVAYEVKYPKQHNLNYY